MLQQLEIPKWKWDIINMDFVTHLSRPVKGHDVIGDSRLVDEEFSFSSS